MFDKIKDMVSNITGGKDLGDINLGGYEKYLEGVTWPISKDELVAAVQRNGADDEVLGMVKGLAGDRFDGVEDVITGLTGGGTDAAKVAEGKVDESADAADRLRNKL